ncbi:MAG: hypothetical protein KDA96_14680, partial [Planctomycetaceae bacterium]|nr:hypothetical protein [Planctomycetaceae bacterium]
MTRMVHHSYLKFAAFLCVVVSFAAGSNGSRAQEKAPLQPGPDNSAPPWGEFLPWIQRQDPLLRAPSHMKKLPDDGGDAAGVAAMIRARELDIPNRKRAIKYLGKLDCGQFPEAKKALLGMLDPQKEQWEEVRYEAAKNLRSMMERSACASGQCQTGQCQTGQCQTGMCQTGMCQSGQCQSGMCQTGQCASGQCASGQCASGQCQPAGVWERCCETAKKTASKVKL